MKDKEFEIFYNSLSVGWHLKRIMELEPEMLNNPLLYNKFISWLDRHNIKPIDKQLSNNAICKRRSKHK
jgi:hypothetical protein